MLDTPAVWVTLLVIVSAILILVAWITCVSFFPASSSSSSSSASPSSSRSQNQSLRHTEKKEEDEEKVGREGFASEDGPVRIPSFCVGDFCVDAQMVKNGVNFYENTVNDMKDRAKKVTEKLDSNIQQRDRIIEVIQEINKERRSNVNELQSRIDEAVLNRKSIRDDFASEMADLEQQRQENAETVDDLIADRSWM